MKKYLLLAMCMLLYTHQVYSLSYEEDIPKEILEKQRQYTGLAIYNMIKHAKINDDNCNISMKTGSGSGRITIIQGEHYYSYLNQIYEGEERHLNIYNCLLSKNQRQIVCDRRLPSNRMAQRWDDYITVTIDLDTNGNAIFLKGVKIRQFNTLLSLFRKKEIASFQCVIEPPNIR